MNEVEKMYENAGIKPKKECYYWDCPYSTGVPANDIPYAERNCQDCKNPDKAVYQPFTAEKQLNILKIIVYSFTFNALDKPIWDKGWDIAIAKLVNIYWEVLTDTEKTQIKEILE